MDSFGKLLLKLPAIWNDVDNIDLDSVLGELLYVYLWERETDYYIREIISERLWCFVMMTIANQYMCFFKNVYLYFNRPDLDKLKYYLECYHLRHPTSNSN